MAVICRFSTRYFDQHGNMHLSCSGRISAANSGHVLVSDNTSSCHGCSGATACGSRLWPQSDNSVVRFELPQSSTLEAGAELTMQMPARDFGLLVSFCYLLPAILLVAGAWLGSRLASTADIGALVGALAGLMVGSGALRLYDSFGGGQAWLSSIKISSAAESDGQA
jgi:positive regulator of sigma E activity